jgi:hypothetical protein
MGEFRETRETGGGREGRRIVLTAPRSVNIFFWPVFPAWKGLAPARRAAILFVKVFTI